MATQAAPHILIAGAGPVGLTAALVLARAGIRVSVFERDASLPQDLRASTWHPPTLDMLDTIDLSLSAHIIEQGLIARYTNHRDRREGLIASFDMEVLRGDTNHPYRVQYEQWRYTRLLVDKLAAYPHVRIVFNARATGAEQTDDRVTLQYESLDGAERVTEGARGDYLIAADGAWSKVRQAVDIEFEGFTFPERFYVASTAFDFASHIEGLSLVNYVSDPDEWCVLLRVPGIWRVLFPTHPDEPDEQIVSDAATEARLQGVLARPERYETTHRTLYSVHQRVAKAYRAGRVFLAGDSAHLNNPLGGMGMNGGLHDAVSLANKLTRVVTGQSPEALLDVYERERRPIAIEYINANTARNRKTMAERDPVERRRNHDEMRRTAEDPALAREFLLRSSMIAALRAASRVR